MRFLPIAAGLLLAASAAPAFAEDFTINVQTDGRNGVCRVYFPRDDGMELEISVRAEDSNTVVSVHNIPGEWTDGNEDKEIALHIAVDTGDAFDTDPNGSYVAGFTYRASGRFSDGAQARILLATLRGSETYSVSFDGHDVGAFAIQQQTGSIRDYAYTFMKTCMKDNGGSTSF